MTQTIPVASSMTLSTLSHSAQRTEQTAVNNRREVSAGPAMVLILLALSTAGCAPASVLNIANTVNYAAEEKTLPDKWLSQWYARDCAIAYLFENNSLCQDDPPDVVTEPTYCYRTLGSPECFESPDPFDPSRRLLGGLPQQRRQAERYRQYVTTGTRWPLKPLTTTTLPPSPAIKGDKKPPVAGEDLPPASPIAANGEDKSAPATESIPSTPAKQTAPAADPAPNIESAPSK